MRKKTLAIWGASGILALGIAAPVAAYATDDKPSSRHQALAEALAKELGVDEAKVSEALTKLHEERKANAPERTKPDRMEALKERLSQAVEEGKLTQAEADAVLKAHEAGVLGGFGHKGPRGS